MVRDLARNQLLEHSKYSLQQARLSDLAGSLSNVSLDEPAERRDVRALFPESRVDEGLQELDVNRKQRDVGRSGFQDLRHQLEDVWSKF